MAIDFRCTQCGKLLRTPDDTAGRQARCPACGQIVTVPAASAPPPPQEDGSPFGDRPLTREEMENPYQAPPDYAVGGPAYGATAPGAITPTLIEMGQVFGNTWAAYKEQWGMALLVLFVGFVLGMVVSYGLQVPAVLVGAVLREPVVGVLLGQVANVATQVFSIWIGIGQAILFLKLLRGQPTSVGEIFSGGPFFLRVFGATILFMLGVGLIVLCGVLPGGVVALVTGGGEIGIVLMIAGGLVAFVFTFVFALTFSQYYYMIVDHNAGVIESFELSRQVTAGNRLTLFAIGLVFGIVGMLLVILTCFVGILAVAPFGALLTPAIYLMMTGQPMARQYTVG